MNALASVCHVSALILENKKGEILIGQRNADDTSPGKWEFPGGKLEKGESFAQALVREIKEELNFTLTSFDLFEVLTHSYPERDICIHFFYAQCAAFTVENHPEHAAVQWVSKDELLHFDLLEANRRILPKILDIG